MHRFTSLLVRYIMQYSEFFKKVKNGDDFEIAFSSVENCNFTTSVLTFVMLYLNYSKCSETPCMGSFQEQFQIRH